MAFPADAAHAHETRSEQNGQVLGNGGTAHGKVAGEGIHGDFATSEKVEEGTAGGIGDGVEDVAGVARGSLRAGFVRGKRKRLLTCYT